MPVRLIAVDLDGTMLGGTKDRYGIFPEGVAALRQAAEEGVMIAVVSGRDYPFIPRLFQEEGVDISLEGWPHLIIAEERCEYRLDAGSYQPDTAWNTEIRAWEQMHYERLCAEVDRKLSDDILRLDPVAFRRVDPMASDRGYIEVRFSEPSFARSAEPILAAMLETLGLPYTTVRNVDHICLRHNHTGKGKMLDRACRRLGIAAGEVLAIGDSLNDMSMLDGRFGFIGAAPANADQEVKAAVLANGGMVAEGQYAKGVAEMIRSL